MRILALVLLAGALVFGQKAPVHPEIRGVVLEPGTNLPVEHAEILFFTQQPGPVKLNGGWKRDETRKTVTGNTGAFTLTVEKPGPYRVEARREGYVGMDLPGQPPKHAEVTLTQDKPVAEVKLFLARPGQVMGSVIDEDTRKPIPSFRLSAARKHGVLGFVSDASATTNAEGRFVASGLTPGEYIVKILPQTAPAKRVLTSFTEQDAKKVDRDYEHTYWPGGHGEDVAMPVNLISGSTVDVGPISVRKVPYHRVHVRIPVSNCAAGDKMSVSEEIIWGRRLSQRRLTEVPCGKDVLVTGFSPGNYRLIFVIQGRTAADRGTASVPFSINNENIEIAASIVPGVPVDGVVIASEGARLPDFSKIKVALRPVDAVGFLDHLPFVVPESDGKFRFPELRLLAHTISIMGVGPTHYVKEIRYNGSPLPDANVPVDRENMTRTLTIVVDDKSGTISGAVTRRGEPVSRPYIIAAKWPLSSDKMLPGWERAKGDENGRFQMGGLAPGEYRLIALSSVEWDTSFEALDEALTTGKKVEVGANGFQTVALEPVELRK
ncbi:MAG TPA: carboxypeptidase-like regulatory domain-containing protein [Bryobacteraceae bacterium]|nr:carboxypeptidase-like regulatory domain-containing protein [Bryobacteraceae bacterium]